MNGNRGTTFSAPFHPLFTTFSVYENAENPNVNRAFAADRGKNARTHRYGEKTKGVHT
jgi:hypothetical protein